MNLDLLILAALSTAQRYKSLQHVVPTSMVSTDTQVMLAWFGAYYNAFPEREAIVVDELISLVRLRSTAASQDQVALMVHLCEQLRKPVDEASVRGILGQLHDW